MQARRWRPALAGREAGGCHLASIVVQLLPSAKRRSLC